MTKPTKDLDEIAEGDYDGKLTPESKAQILKHYRSVDDIKKAVGEILPKYITRDTHKGSVNRIRLQAEQEILTALGIEGESNE